MYLTLDAAFKIFRVAKIVIAKSLGKITKRLKQNRHEISKSIVHRYLRQTVVAFKSYFQYLVIYKQLAIRQRFWDTLYSCRYKPDTHIHTQQVI